MKIVKKIGKEMDKLLKHKNLRLVLILMVTIYSALVAPALPNSIIKFFDTILGKLLFVFLIGYMASKNIQVALVISIGFIVTLQIVERKKIENYINFIEGFEESGSGADGDEKKCESDELNPLTAYARSKIACEEELEKLVDSNNVSSC